MSDIGQLLNFTKHIVLEVAEKVVNHRDSKILKSHTYDDNLKKEIKAFADKFIEASLIKALEETRVPILSEEKGYFGKVRGSKYLFIVDPLDGTFNYIRNFGAYCISVALWYKEEAVFGVIYDLSRRELYWGGKNFGSFFENFNIKVSRISKLEHSIICSGFPVRYDMQDLKTDNYLKVLSKFAKVRMIGSAAISLINIAKGAADAYYEKDIMIWDVAAGIAIVEGAGGSSFLVKKSNMHTFDVFVHNNLMHEIKDIINEC